jgi:hypothetical protein
MGLARGDSLEYSFRGPMTVTATDGELADRAIAEGHEFLRDHDGSHLRTAEELLSELNRRRGGRMAEVQQFIGEAYHRRYDAPRAEHFGWDGKPFYWESRWTSARGIWVRTPVPL